MADYSTEYLIIGGGLAGASAIEGIRERDKDKSITLIGAEPHLPYDRPPLSKKLWFGKKQVKDIFLHDHAFYDANGVKLLLGRRAMSLDANNRTVTDDLGNTCRFGRLLLAVGSAPRRLSIPGGDLDGLCYYRTLDDYQRIRSAAKEGASALLIGGGFIGSEIAAALCMNKVKVTMLYPSGWLCDRVFLEDLGLAMERFYQSKGIRFVKGRKPVSIARANSRFAVQTDGGEKLEADILIIGVGVAPVAGLAEKAGLQSGDGVVVNEYLQTSNPDIYAAGDLARFPYKALGMEARVEHWDNALNQGKQAGRNMAGAREPYSYMPYFFSDLFEFGYEAVGEVSSRMEIRAEWKKPFDTGVIYYQRDGKVRGAMMCNVWEKVEAARDMIRRGASANERL